MDLLMRNNVQSWIEEKADKYGSVDRILITTGVIRYSVITSCLFLSLDLIINGSFVAQYGFKQKFCASDFVYGASALLESIEGVGSDDHVRFPLVLVINTVYNWPLAEQWRHS